MSRMLSTMIVEDNLDFRELVRDYLRSQFPSIKIVEVGTGEEALEGLHTHPSDLVFMDIHLPGRNGFEITKMIRAGRQDITIIILTSYDFPEYREAATACGANGFIGKDSLEWEEISAIVKCHGEANRKGRNPACVRLITEG